MEEASVFGTNEALARLAAIQPQWAEVIQHRYYAGLTIEKTVQMLDINEKTMRRWWQRARVLLHDEILAIMQEEA